MPYLTIYFLCYERPLQIDLRVSVLLYFALAPAYGHRLLTLVNILGQWTSKVNATLVFGARHYILDRVEGVHDFVLFGKLFRSILATGR